LIVFSGTFDEYLRNTAPIIMKCGFTLRLGRTRPVHARSSGSERLLRIRSLAAYTIDTLESSFRKGQGADQAPARYGASCCDSELRASRSPLAFLPRPRRT